MIHSISIFLLLLEFIVGFYRIQYALIIALSIIFLVPNYVKFHVGINLNVFNLAVFIIVILLLKDILKYRPHYPRLKNILLFYTCFIVITSFLSSLVEGLQSEYISNMILFFMEYTLLAFVLCWVRMSEKDIKIFNVVIGLVGLIIVIYAFFNYATKINPYLTYISIVTDTDDYSAGYMTEQRGILDGRVSSTFILPLQLGQCMLFLFSYFFYEMRGKLLGVIRIVYLSLLFVTTILTGSRSSLVPVLSVPLLYAIQMKPLLIVRYSLITLFFGGIVYLSLPNQYKDYIVSNIMFWDDEAARKAGVEGSSAEGRFYQIGVAMDAISDNPLLGKGFKYQNNHRDMLPVGVYGSESIFLLNLIESGLLGLIVFVFFYFWLYKLLIKKCKLKFDRLRAQGLCFSFFISISLTGITYSFFCVYMIFYMITLYRIENNDALLSNQIAKLPNN